MIRKGTRVRIVETGQTGRVVAVIRWDRTEYRVLLDGGPTLTFDTREVVKA